MENKQRKSSEAQIRANSKYNKKTYNNIAIRVKPIEFDFIDNLAKSQNLSKASLIVRALHYIADNNIDLSADNNNEVEE